MTIILKKDVLESLYKYEYLTKQHKEAVKTLNSLCLELKSVRKRANEKGYQSYKAVTTKLRREQQDIVSDLFYRKHNANIDLELIKSKERMQNSLNDNQKKLENLLKSISYEDCNLLRDYFNNDK